MLVVRFYTESAQALVVSELSDINIYKTGNRIHWNKQIVATDKQQACAPKFSRSAPQSVFQTSLSLLKSTVYNYDENKNIFWMTSETSLVHSW